MAGPLLRGRSRDSSWALGKRLPLECWDLIDPLEDQAKPAEADLDSSKSYSPDTQEKLYYESLIAVLSALSHLRMLFVSVPAMETCRTCSD